jgi:hypothetical protein
MATTLNRYHNKRPPPACFTRVPGLGFYSIPPEIIIDARIEAIYTGLRPNAPYTTPYRPLPPDASVATLITSTYLSIVLGNPLPLIITGGSLIIYYATGLKSPYCEQSRGDTFSANLRLTANPPDYHAVAQIPPQDIDDGGCYAACNLDLQYDPTTKLASLAWEFWYASKGRKNPFGENQWTWSSNCGGTITVPYPIQQVLTPARRHAIPKPHDSRPTWSDCKGLFPPQPTYYHDCCNLYLSSPGPPPKP